MLCCIRAVTPSPNYLLRQEVQRCQGWGLRPLFPIASTHSAVSSQHKWGRRLVTYSWSLEKEGLPEALEKKLRSTGQGSKQEGYKCWGKAAKQGIKKIQNQDVMQATGPGTRVAGDRQRDHRKLTPAWVKEEMSGEGVTCPRGQGSLREGISCFSAHRGKSRVLGL